jgi:hypothetical protein
VKNIGGAWVGLKEADEGLGWDALEHAEEKFGNALGVVFHDAEKDSVHPSKEF